MESIRVKAISEDDFDGIVESVGGSRIIEDDSADYNLSEAIVELKLVLEEGFEKTERQRKIADLFRKTQANQPVVTIRPARLSESDLRDYFRIVEVPIKNACKKASKQLQKTAARSNSKPVRVLVILNVGYTLLSPDEFKEVCFKCVRNDTTGIDWLLCGGIYIYSDGFDNIVLGPLEEFPINLRCSFPSRRALVEAWGLFLDNLMTDAIRNPDLFNKGRMPVIDLIFDLDGIRYVRPAPAMPNLSGFWPEGEAPRENSSGLISCPPVARTFPALSDKEWQRFKNAMPDSKRLKDTLGDWVRSYPEENPVSREPLKPLVLVDVEFEDFEHWIGKPQQQWEFTDVAKFSSQVLHRRALDLFGSAKNREAIKVLPLNYIYLVSTEVGNDKANDFASIYYMSEIPGFERKEPLIENKRIFFEYALAVAAAYAVKHKVDAILYTKCPER
jgi:hypothetical protein